MKRFAVLPLLVALFAGALLALAQESYVPITRETAAEIVQVSRLGNGAVRSLVLSPDAAQLAIATTLGVWLAAIDEPATAPVLHEGQGGAFSASFHPDGSLIAGGGDDGSVMVWDTQTGETIARLENHLYPISALAWSADGALLASGDWSGIVRVWDVATWGEYRVFPTSEKIERLTFADDTLTALSLETEYLWAVADNALISQNERTTELGNNTDIRVGELRAVWYERPGVIQIWDKTEFVSTFFGFGCELCTVSFGEDDQLQISVTPQLEQPLDEADQAQVLSPDQSIMATFGNDGIIRLLNVATGDRIAALYGHIRKINAVAFSPDGVLLVSASDDGTLQIWDATTQEDSGSLMTLEGHTSGVTSVGFNAAGTLIASSSYDGTIRTWGIPQ